MIFRRNEKQESNDRGSAGTEIQQRSDSASGGKPAREPRHAVQSKQASPNPASRDPLANDLILRVMKAIDDWARANKLTSLPRRVAFEQALSILNALDRSFPDAD